MRAKLPVSILLAGLLAVAAMQSGRADPPAPDATLKLKGEDTFDFEQRRIAQDCGGEGWDFRFDTKSTDFKFAWLGDGVGRRFFALKAEVWRIDESGGCYIGSSVERMEVSAFESSKSGQANPLYTVSITPESHDGFADIDIVEWSGAWLRLYAGERDEVSDTERPLGPYWYYDLATGTFLFRAGDWSSITALFVADAAKPSRFIAVSPRTWERDGNGELLDRALIATITYASLQGAIQKVQLRESGSARIPDLSELEPRPTLIGGPLQTIAVGEVRLPRKSGDSETFDGRTVRIHLNETVSFDMPLVRDRLDLEHTILPPGLALSPIQ